MEVLSAADEAQWAMIYPEVRVACALASRESLQQAETPAPGQGGVEGMFAG